jgi:hypothetical protein
MWNTLHANRAQGTFTIKPYYQKFQKDHTVYLQFCSEANASVTLASYVGNTQIDTWTVKWDDSAAAGSHYGTIDNRYFTNFVVTLDSDYYDKKVRFVATQRSDVLTSEPVYIYDLTPELAKGTLKYIKYTNLDREESDLDDRFIDWSILQSTGKYMDFFVDAIDIDPNDSDKNEILEGSQTKTIISASYFSGRVLKTAGIPDYMAARMGVASSLDVFTVNGLQYIKSEEISQERYGSTTLYQVSLRLTQKVAIGINVDNIEQAGPILISAVVSQAFQNILLTFNTLLDSTVNIDVSAFVVMINDVEVAIDTMAYGSEVGSGYTDANIAVNLVNQIVVGDRTTITYTKPTADPLKGITGGEVESFNASVVNNIESATSIDPTTLEWNNDEVDTRTFVVTTDLNRWYFGSGTNQGDFTVEVYDSTNTTKVTDGVYESGMVVRVTPLSVNYGATDNVCSLIIADAGNITLCTFAGTHLGTDSELSINNSSCRFYQDGTPLDTNSFIVTHTDTYTAAWADGAHFYFNQVGDAFVITAGINTSGSNYTDTIIITQGAFVVNFEVVQYYEPGIIT